MSPRKKRLPARRRARRLSLQALYEIDSTEHPMSEVITERLDTSTLSENTLAFAKQIVEGVQKHGVTLDQVIVAYAPEWPLDKQAIVDRNILRMAVYELFFMPETPHKVVVNEAVELAKRYGSDSSPIFVNGVLGGVITNYKQIVDRLN